MVLLAFDSWTNSKETRPGLDHGDPRPFKGLRAKVAQELTAKGVEKWRDQALCCKAVEDRHHPIRIQTWQTKGDALREQACGLAKIIAMLLRKKLHGVQ